MSEQISVTRVFRDGPLPVISRARWLAASEQMRQSLLGIFQKQIARHRFAATS